MTRPDAHAFRLRAGESLRTAVRRIACAEIDAVIAALEGPIRDDTVHEVRKATKRLRALLRLVRDHLGPRRYARENRTFRDSARALSPARDAEVLVATVDRLAEGRGRRPRILTPLRRAVPIVCTPRSTVAIRAPSAGGSWRACGARGHACASGRFPTAAGGLSAPVSAASTAAAAAAGARPPPSRPSPSCTSGGSGPRTSATRSTCSSPYGPRR